MRGLRGTGGNEPEKLFGIEGPPEERTPLMGRQHPTSTRRFAMRSFPYHAKALRIERLEDRHVLSAALPGDLLLAIENPDIAIVDIRTDIEYQGLTSEANRPGHIPTALNFPADLNLEMQQGIRYFKSPEVFEELYKDLVDYDEVILYCNNGCESSTTFLALRLLGKQVSIYDGGWREWGNNPGLPVVAPKQ